MGSSNLYSGLANVDSWHPDDLSDWLERIWADGSTAWNLAATVDGKGPTKPPGQFPPSSSSKTQLSWPHLIYAYLIENTTVYEVFAQVLKEFAIGEKLGVPTPESANWLRLTECLFYRHPSASLIYSVESEVRPDHRAVRRNAYFRMFGMDLNHGASGSQAYPYERPAAANKDFVPVFEEFLREVWIGIVNSNNTSGANPTDDAKIANQARQLSEMLTLRRFGWNLAREEFFSVALMAWFEYTLSGNTEIVRVLRAEAGSPSARLAKVAARVGMAIPRMTDEYFQMAVPLSGTMQAIESGQFNGITTASTFYRSAGLRQDLLTIIDNWSRATGHDIKSTRVQLSRA
jgi:hypothetical protein